TGGRPVRLSDRPPAAGGHRPRGARGGRSGSRTGRPPVRWRRAPRRGPPRRRPDRRPPTPSWCRGWSTRPPETNPSLPSPRATRSDHPPVPLRRVAIAAVLRQVDDRIVEPVALRCGDVVHLDADPGVVGRTGGRPRRRGAVGGPRVGRRQTVHFCLPARRAVV